MSWRSVKKPAGSELPRRRWSITQRLVITYTFSAIAMLAITAVFLNWTLHSSLLKAEEDYIDDRIRVYRAIIEHSPDFLYSIMQDIEWQGSFVKFPQYYARILNERCHTIIETIHMNELIPPERFPDPCIFTKAEQERTRARKHVVYVGRNGRSYLLESYWTEKLQPQQRVAIQIAVDITSQESLIRTNQQRMVAIIMLGIIFAGLFSVIVARRVLSPLNELAETAKQITFDKISISATDPESWPVELQTLALAFNDMLARLRDSFTRLSQYTSNLAHELRTPINNLMGEAEVALSQERSLEEYRNVLESGLEEHMRLSRMIDALLFLARAEHPSHLMEHVIFSPLEEIERVCSFYEALAEEKQARFSWGGSGKIEGDPTLFRRIMSNLISNALYYSGAGVNIDMQVKESARFTEITVSDSGYGIAEEDLSKIFDRFYRVMTSRSSNPQGSGLGLSIVKSIMDLHHGTVSIRSAHGQGTTITLRFPSPRSTKKPSTSTQ
ncbi:MAG TPA: heavy metal sensor histidine kinase [Desulfuromonadaceae bacterium]|jgi:two-component system heavy metal sensor histidine kinase CusS